jgi:NADH:ubiquinone oxidoreductase subunit 3 (subunit A)
MKLSIFFALFDVIVILAYPIAYVIHRLRRMKGVK